MSLTLHFHPLASFCWKALIALYENDIPFKPNLVDLGNPGRARGAAKTVADRQVSGAGGPGTRGRSSRSRASSSTISTAIIRAVPDSSPTSPSSPGRRGCATASMTSTCICRCRRSWATGCVPRDRRTRTASRRRGRRLRTSYGIIEQQIRPADLGDGRDLQPGRLRGGAVVVLRQHGGAVRRPGRQSRGLFRAAEGAAVLCARAEGGRALFQHGAEGELNGRSR